MKNPQLSATLEPTCPHGVVKPALCPRCENDGKQQSALLREVEYSRQSRADFEEAHTKLLNARAALHEIRSVATGEREVAGDDTGALAWITEYIDATFSIGAVDVFPVGQHCVHGASIKDFCTKCEMESSVIAKPKRSTK